MLTSGLLPERFGSPWLWLGAGVLVTAFVFVGLYRWQNVWFARVVWAVHGLRLPTLVRGAFFAAPAAVTPPAFYITAIVVVCVEASEIPWACAKIAERAYHLERLTADDVNMAVPIVSDVDELLLRV